MLFDNPAFSKQSIQIFIIRDKLGN